MIIKTKSCFSVINKHFYSNKACLVYIAKTTDPYLNLGFEHWLYKNRSFDDQHILLVWRNQPSIIIGRHQNPWKECNISLAQSNKVNICRRDSGGGAVYHDLGNVNFTFFTDQKDHNRKKNLNTIVSGLKKKWPILDLNVNKRDDIVLNKQYKISGTAAKLTRKSSYHHCTLLIDSNKEDINKYLTSNEWTMSCNATSSVSSNVMNLCDVDNTINFKDVCSSVIESYISLYSYSEVLSISANNETLAPGVLKTADAYKNWNWVFGKTPTFKVFKDFNTNVFYLHCFEIEIKQGKVINVDIKGNPFLNIRVVETFKQYLIGLNYSKEAIVNKLNLIQNEFYSFNNNQTSDSSLYNFLFKEIVSLFS